MQDTALALVISPLVGFGAAALLLPPAATVVIKNPSLYRLPEGETPPLWIRGLLVLTCISASVARGSSDGQKAWASSC